MQVLHRLPKFDDPRILVSGETMADAGVFRIKKDLALVQTVDVLTPITDDPYIFGQIVGANALSDVYAMGGVPLTGLTILAYPPDRIDPQTIGRMLRGLARKVKEAGASILGGHTIKDTELKCGLAVTGLVNPKKMITNSHARIGDQLVLTKPLGTGVISTAGKAGRASRRALLQIQRTMVQLNATASRVMVEVGASSAVDVTGFGLLGHAFQMAEASDVTMVIKASAVPFIEEAHELAKEGLFPGGSVKNYEYAGTRVSFDPRVATETRMLMCDAQTSGGLLIAVAKKRSQRLCELLTKRGVRFASIIGQVVASRSRHLYIEA
jgi:selenide,water dikinase